jgi:hypothetical protein
VYFRPEKNPAFSPNYNRVESNQIVDSGKADGVGIDVQGFTREVHLLKNTIRETREPAQRIGIRLGADTREIVLEGNRIEGVAVPMQDLRKA